MEAEAAPAPSNALPVLTNNKTIEAQVQTKPRDRTAITSRVPGAPPPIAAADTGGGAAPPPVGGGGGPAGAAKKPFDGQIVGGFDDGIRGGLRMRLGCASPDTYKLTAAERAACLQQLANVAKTTPQLGLNIAPGKLGDLNRAAACHAATSGKEVPGSSADNDSTGKIRGLGSNPRLRDCGPGER